MAETGNRFQIVPERMGEAYVLENADGLLEACDAYVARHSLISGIETRDDYRFAKDAKKDVSALRKSVTKKRIDVNDILMGGYNGTMKSVERKLDSCEQSLRREIEAYELKEFGKAVRPRIMTLEVKGYDQAKLKMVEEYAAKLGLTAKTKGETVNGKQ